MKGSVGPLCISGGTGDSSAVLTARVRSTSISTDAYTLFIYMLTSCPYIGRILRVIFQGVVRGSCGGDPCGLHFAEWACCGAVRGQWVAMGLPFAPIEPFWAATKVQPTGVPSTGAPYQPCEY